MKNYCNESNLVSCLSNLDKELEISDYSPIFGNNQRDTKVILVNAVNVLHSVLADLRTRTASNNDLTLENARLKNQIESLNGRLACKSQSLDKEVRKSEDLKKSLNDIVLAKETVEKQLKQTKTECQQLRKNLDHQACQHEHEIRRRDGEIDRLRIRIRPGSVKRSPQQCDTSEQDGHCTGAELTDRLKENYIQSLVDNVQHVVSENCCLRACLLELRDRALDSFPTSHEEHSRNLLHLTAEEIARESRTTILKALEVSS